MSSANHFHLVALGHRHRPACGLNINSEIQPDSLQVANALAVHPTNGKCITSFSGFHARHRHEPTVPIFSSPQHRFAIPLLEYQPTRNLIRAHCPNSSGLHPCCKSTSYPAITHQLSISDLPPVLRKATALLNLTPQHYRSIISSDRRPNTSLRSSGICTNRVL